MDVGRGCQHQELSRKREGKSLIEDSGVWAGEVLLFVSLWCRAEPSVAQALWVSRAALRRQSFIALRDSEKVLKNRSMMLTSVLLFQLSRLASTSNILLCRKGKCPCEVGYFWPSSSHPSTQGPKLFNT